MTQALREWAKEIVSRTGETIAFHATSQGPIAVTVVTERGYKVLLAGAAFDKTDSLFSTEAPAGATDGRVRLPCRLALQKAENAGPP